MAKRTITNRADPRRNASASPAAYLVRVLAYEHPRAPGSRHRLDPVTKVELGRAEVAGVARDGSTLRFALDDPRMSQRHARLTADAATWVIEDLGSRNGTFVDGTRVERCELHDGAVIELGRTVFMYRIGRGDARADVSADELAPIAGIRTWSTTFATQLAAVERLALTTTSIVLHGATGTGKEVLARGIHTASRRGGPFVAVNCASLPANLIESELFGFKKGAFSGAAEDRVGLIRAAHGGTLFLDEIGDLPAQTQVAMLRVLQEREVLPIGATRAVSVDLRVVSASHRDLEAAVRSGAFREDLLARLAGFVVEVPTLGARREDLGLLIESLLDRVGAPADLQISPEAGLVMLVHDWPRNIRELEHVLTRAVALAAGHVIELEHLNLGRHAVDMAEDLAPSDVRRRDQLRTLLATHHGNIAAVAREMRVARVQIHRWLARFEIDITAYRRSK